MSTLNRYTEKYLTITLLVVLMGCTENFLDINNPNNLDSDIFWDDSIRANQGVVAIYSEFTFNKIYGRCLSVALCVMSHEADLDWLQKTEWNELGTNELTSTNYDVLRSWQYFYEIIAKANDAIKNIPEVGTDILTKMNRDDLLGQSYFLRALAYFHMVRLWGEDSPVRNPDALSVPLMLEDTEELYPSRATVGEVYAQIISDLEKAIELLPAGRRSPEELGRISGDAAIAYLGKVYLYMENYTIAKQYLGQIATSSNYGLMDTLYTAVDGEHEFNKESIFEWHYSTGSEGLADVYQEGTFNHWTLYHGPVEMGVWANFFVSDYSMARFGDDPRLAESVFRKQIKDSEGHIIFSGDKVLATASGLKLPVRKYNATRKFISNETFGSQWPGWPTNIVPMRLADVYLMYAEALNALGQDPEALEYVNRLHRRAYYKNYLVPDPEVDYSGLSGMPLRDTIREERWRELHYECHRWYDICRWGIVEEEITRAGSSRAGAVKFDPKDYYFPIPQREILTNPNLVQSKDY